MLQKLYCCRYFAVAIVAVFIFLFSSYSVLLPTAKTSLSKYTVTEGVLASNLQPPRKSLLIIGQGRSGTSFVSKMIANGERVSQRFCPQITVPKCKSSKRVDSLRDHQHNFHRHRASSQSKALKTGERSCFFSAISFVNPR